MASNKMKHLFSQVPQAQIQRSSFDRSHTVKTTFDAGYLVPIMVDEALPGDTFNLSTTVFARLSTPIVPIMDNIYLDIFFFSVPYRLVWENWEKFNGEQDNPGDSTDYLVPTVTAPEGGWQTESLSDYFGLPTQVAGIEADSLFHRAYNLIWNEWFRDENLQTSVPVPTDDGPDNDSDFVLLKRGKRHDYFTSALPWPQKGPGVELPIGSTAPVVGNGIALGLFDGSGYGGLYRANGEQLKAQTGSYGLPVGSTDGSGFSLSNVIGLTQDASKSGMVADLSEATAATINSLRQAFAIQRLFERDARGGTRYTEIIRSHFGVVSPDARLQRPEFLGGGEVYVNISPIAQTSGTVGTSSTPQGNLAAFGVGVMSGKGFSRSFTEHCLIIGLISARADLTYQQGLPRMFSRQTRWDFYWPALAHLGEQAILNKEIYAQGPSVLNSEGQPVDDDVFGYQERYAEYRYYPNQITGKMRSNTPGGGFDIWHLAQNFNNLPTLGDTFIEEAPPISRVVAVPSEPAFYADIRFNCRCARPMPLYGVPGLIDHF